MRNPRESLPGPAPAAADELDELDEAACTLLALRPSDDGAGMRSAEAGTPPRCTSGGGEPPTCGMVDIFFCTVKVTQVTQLLRRVKTRRSDKRLREEGAPGATSLCAGTLCKQCV